MPNEVTFAIPTIPDLGDHQLAAGCGGDVRARAMAATESLLRTLAILPEGAVTCAIRFAYDPTRSFQDRTQVSLTLRGAEGTPWLSLVKRIVDPGALKHVFESLRPFEKDGRDQQRLDAVRAGVSACCDVTRLEHAVASDEDLRKGRAEGDIPSRYWVPRPFEPRDENDWSMLDRILADLKSPALVEIIVAPADITNERGIQFEYTKLLMGINSFSDDLTVRGFQADASLQRSDVGKVRDPMADEFLSDHQELRKRLIEPHLAFVVRAWGATVEDARLLAAVCAECGFGQGKYRLIDSKAKDHAAKESAVIGALRLASESDDATVAPQWEEFWSAPDLSKGMRLLKRLPHLATVEELAAVFRLPVGLPSIAPRTIARARTEPPRTRRDAKGQVRPTILIGDDLEMGVPVERPPRREALGEIFEGAMSDVPEIRLPLELLKKHLFIAGVPGSGKTTAMNNFVVQLAFREVPFLVIEPAKTEYRVFAQLREHPDPVVARLAKTIRVYSVGHERISPFRFNPLAYPQGISLDEHMNAVVTAFRASMPMEGPMVGLLTDAVEAAYQNPPANARFPRLRDVYEQAKGIVKKRGYTGEVLDNLTAALDLRLGGLIRGDLGRVFDCDVGIPDVNTLFTEPVVLEMDYLSQEHACLMTLMILSALREHIRITRASGSDLKHVTFIEEAHNIVGRVPPAASGEADPRGFAADFVARMLAEVRALGEGIIIADQLPSAVSPEVVKNTGAKLAHRLVANDDREELGGTMLLDDVGIQELARLSPGEAYFYAEGFYRPRRVRAVPSHLLLGVESDADRAGVYKMPNPAKREELRGIVSADAWSVADANGRIAAVREEATDLCEHLQATADSMREAIDSAEAAFLSWIDDIEDSEARGAVEWESQRLKSLNGRFAEARAQVRQRLQRLLAEDALEQVSSPQGLERRDELRNLRRGAERVFAVTEAVREHAESVWRWVERMEKDQAEESE